MNTAKALAQIYATILKEDGPIEARQYVAMVVSNTIDDLQIDNIPVTAENIEKRLVEKTQIYIDDSSEEVA